ncbi:MAG: efflux RND transporter periplasmic adaptor subunit [Planctomycetota bacterium]|nr:efflux RND transporter periplasmic adaptor subunit [Planctomycetota bacterium]
MVSAVVGFAGWRWDQTATEAPAELSLQGNVDVRQVNLSFKVGGRITDLLVDEGDKVEAGQVLATLDQRYFEDDLQRTKAQRDQAAATLKRLENGSRPEEIEQAQAQEAERQATLSKVEDDLRRAEILQPKGAMSAEELGLRKSAALEAKARLRFATASRRLFEAGSRLEDIAAARAFLDATQAQVVAAERAVDDSRLLALSDAVVLTRTREKGAVVSPGETVFSLTLVSPVWVRTYVSEPDLGLIQPGMMVAVTTDAVAGREYPGRIGFVSPTAEFTPKTVETRELRTALVYRLRVVVDDPDGGLRQGMPVTVLVELPGKRPRTFKERMEETFHLDRAFFPQ